MVALSLKQSLDMVELSLKQGIDMEALFLKQCINTVAVRIATAREKADLADDLLCSENVKTNLSSFITLLAKLRTFGDGQEEFTV